jgi:hypothetical protein
MSNLEQWLKDAKDYLQNSFGLESKFADSVALLIAYFFYYNLNPIITSGYRDKMKQLELTRRWKSGDPTIVVKPASDSLHSRTSFLGSPAALAIDIDTNDKRFAAEVAQLLGIGAGYFFTTPDPVHFYHRGL